MAALWIHTLPPEPEQNKRFRGKPDLREMPNRDYYQILYFLPFINDSIDEEIVRRTDRLCLMDLGTKTDIPAGKAYVDHICVLSKFRGKGIGKILLDMADMDARKKGCKEFALMEKDL